MSAPYRETPAPEAEPAPPFRVLFKAPIRAFILTSAASVLALGFAGAEALWRYYPEAPEKPQACVDETRNDCRHPDQRMVVIEGWTRCICRRAGQEVPK